MLGSVDVAEQDLAPAGAERVRHAPVSGGGERQIACAQRAALERMASGIGNRRLARLATRLQDGEGILPGGLVHPDVEAAIARARGGGRALEDAVSRRLEPRYGPLPDVRVHTGEAAKALARAVSARAFTVGGDIFFADGEYRPGTPGGDDLIAHEVVHVMQQRGAPATGRLTVSKPGDDLEREAEALGRDVPS
jgi:uncharacterized protein DUF4157